MVRFALALAIWAASGLPAAAEDHLVRLTDGSRVRAPELSYYRECIRVTMITGRTRDLDWGEVLSLGERPSTLCFGDGETLKGLVVGLDGYDEVILVHDLLGRLTIPRRLLPATPPDAPHALLVNKPTGDVEKVSNDALEVAVKGALEEKPWNGRVALGASLSAGNSDTFTATLDALIQRD
ncbi:MAG: hypothetical protein KDB53_11585, partial [Planctomycetes bacterium]|nr:hypothetical protein [Planctomycetota bacterium]